MDALLSHDHTEIDLLLTVALRKLDAGDAAAFRSLDLFWARLAMHIRAEHHHLFPAVIRISDAEKLSYVPEVVERLRLDHDFFMHELADIINAMRSMNPDNDRVTISDAARRVGVIKDRLIAHNAIEEEQIYKLGIFFSEKDSEVLSRSVAEELANVPPRFSE